MGDAFRAVTVLTLVAGLNIGFGFSGFGSAYAEDCPSIQNPNDRLSCYDRAARRQSSKLNYEPSVTPQMTDARTKLSNTMLEAGLDIEVSIATKDFIYPEGPYPALIFFGELDRVLIYKLVKSANILQVARSAGYQSVVFSAKQANLPQRWRFDISGNGSQTCARDLCFPI